MGMHCCFRAYRRLAVTEGNMNSAFYQKILKKNIWSSVCKVKLKHNKIILFRLEMCSNVPELKQFCKYEWAEIPPQCCKKLISSYQKDLVAVIGTKILSLGGN